MREESWPVSLARQSLTEFIAHKKVLMPPADLPPEMTDKAGVFVSLKKAGQLRGCIGTFGPTQPTIAQEIIQNAISAGTRDPRFWTVEIHEMPELIISVDILSEPEPVAGVDQLDPKQYGVIVTQGRRSGLLLPDLEGVDNVEQQVAIARQKAGIASEEKVDLFRFRVTRYT